MSDLSPEIVLSEYSKLTGIKFQSVPYGVKKQAAEFCRAGLTLDDLAVVIEWTRRQIRDRKQGFTAASVCWKNLMGQHGMGHELQTLQERLGLARHEMLTGKWKPCREREKPSETPSKPLPEPAPVEKGTEIAAGLRAFLGEMRKPI